MCCDQIWFKCNCANPLEWDEQYKLIPAEWMQDVYTFTAECGTCAFWYTENCHPMRNWLRNAIENKAFPGSIDDICSEYISCEEYKTIEHYYADSECEF